MSDIEWVEAPGVPYSSGVEPVVLVTVSGAISAGDVAYVQLKASPEVYDVARSALRQSALNEFVRRFPAATDVRGDVILWGGTHA